MYSNRMTKQLSVLPSFSDYSSGLGLYSIFNIFQDLAGEHACQIGVGAVDLRKKGMVWVIAKTRLKICGPLPGITEYFDALTWPGKHKGIVDPRYYRLSQNGRVFAEGKSEWVVLKEDSQKMVNFDNIFPENFEFYEEEAAPGRFGRIDPDFEGCPVLGGHRIKSTDVDFVGHMNNVAYVRAVENCLSREQLNALKIRTIDIHYKRQSFEGEQLVFRFRKAEGGYELGAFVDDRNVLLARIELAEQGSADEA